MRLAILGSALLFFVFSAGCKPRTADSAVKGTTDTIRPETLAKDQDLPDDGIWMFHFGERRFLEGIYHDRTEGEAGKGAITDAEWQKIPSNGTTYAPNRRGLYVGQHPIYNERYAADTLFQNGESTSGLMAVRIRKSCFAPEHMSGNIFDAQSPISFEHARFKAFVDADATWRQSGGFAGFFTTCTNAYLGQNPQQGYQENTCNQAVKKYYDTNGIQMVYDHEWLESGFWLVRSPACVTRIVSTPEGILQVLAKTYDLWDPAPFASGKVAAPSQTTPLVPTTATFAIAVQALARSAQMEISEETLYRLAAMARATKNNSYSSQYDRVLQKAYDCRRDGNWGEFLPAAEAFSNGLAGPAGALAGQHLEQEIRKLAAQAEVVKCSPKSDETLAAMEKVVDEDLVKWAQKRPKPLPPVDPKIQAAQARKARLAQLSQELATIRNDIVNSDRQENESYRQYSVAHNQVGYLIDQLNPMVDRFNAGNYSLDNAIDSKRAEISRARSTKSSWETSWDQWKANGTALRAKQSQLNQEYTNLSRQR